MTQHITDIVANAKGGVGKTTFAVSLVDYRRTRERAQLGLIEIDTQTKLSKFFPDQVKSLAANVDFERLRADPNQAFKLFDEIGSVMVRHDTIVDLGANTTDAFWAWWSHRRLALALRQADIKVRVWVVANRDAAAVDGAAAFLSRAVDETPDSEFYFVHNYVAGSFSPAAPESLTPVLAKFAAKGCKPNPVHMERCWSEIWNQTQDLYLAPSIVRAMSDEQIIEICKIEPFTVFGARADYNSWNDKLLTSIEDALDAATTRTHAHPSCASEVQAVA